jgi:hypothetical protein
MKYCLTNKEKQRKKEFVDRECLGRGKSIIIPAPARKIKIRFKISKATDKFYEKSFNTLSKPILKIVDKIKHIYKQELK